MKTYITDGLTEYLEGGNSPWHMPGHKRKPLFQGSSVRDIISSAMQMDMTEVPGVDDLFHPEGMIAASLGELKRIYQTAGSFYMVNGSTGGILAAISACAAGNAKRSILAARNCHKSVYNAISLLGLKSIYVEPAKNGGSWEAIDGSIRAYDVKKLCETNSDICAMVLTSPTYEGVLSDISEIKKILKHYGISLIVDEAHGAELPFINELPESAVCQGADIVIQSLHKTLPALTQTGIIHVIDTELLPKVQKYLALYQSSSPSYIFMSSMELAVDWAENRDYTEYIFLLTAFREKTAGLHNIKIFDGKADCNFAFDSTRIVLGGMYRDGTALTGRELADRLAKRKIIVEMSGRDYVVLISTAADEAKDFEELFAALTDIDIELAAEKSPEKEENIQNVELLKRLGAAEGEPSEHNIFVYPPGSYIITEGEIITGAAVERLKKLSEAGILIRVS